MRPRLKIRKAPLLAIVISVAIGAALAAACAGLIYTAVRLETPPRQFEGSALVVSSPEHATLAAAEGSPEQSVALSERATLPAAAGRSVLATPGVRTTERLRPWALGVVPRAGIDLDALRSRLEARLGGSASVLAGDARGRAETSGVAAARLKLFILAGVFGGTALVIMAILLTAIVNLSVEQRHRELALLRRIGATPAQVRQMIRDQLVVPAFLAALVGSAAGPILAGRMFDALRDGGVVPAALRLNADELTVAGGALATFLVVRLSIAIASRRAAKASFAEALGEVDAEPGAIGPVRKWLAIAFAAVAGSCAAMTPFASPENAEAIGGGVAMAGAVAFAFAAPLLTVRILDRLEERFGSGRLLARLASINARLRSRRTAALAVPVVLVVAITLGNVYAQTTQAGAMHDSYVGDLRADGVVTSSSGKVPEAVVAAAEKTAAPISPLVTSKGWIEHPVDSSHRNDPWTLLGAEPAAIKAPVAAGSLADLRGDAVALPAGTAGALGVEVGDRVGLVLGDGDHARVRVAALLDEPGKYPSLILPAPLLLAHTTEGAPEALLVEGDAATARVRHALEGTAGVSVRGGSALGATYDDGLQVDQSIAYSVLAVIVAFAALTLINALVAAFGARRRELRLLGLAGATRSQILGMLGAEGALVAIVGILAGTCIALLGLVPLSFATSGSPVPSGPAWLLPLTLLGVFALVLLPTWVIARVTLRQIGVR